MIGICQLCIDICQRSVGMMTECAHYCPECRNGACPPWPRVPSTTSPPPSIWDKVQDAADHPAIYIVIFAIGLVLIIGIIYYLCTRRHPVQPIQATDDHCDQDREKMIPNDPWNEDREKMIP